MSQDQEQGHELNHVPDHRPMRYIEVDDASGLVRVVYRASSLGGCDRAFLACARDMDARPHPDWFQQVLDEGTNAEAAIDAWWEAATNVPTVLRQAELILDTLIETEVTHPVTGEKVSAGVVVKAHVDGFAAPSDQEVQDGTVTVREYKKFRPSTYPNFQRQGVEVQKNYPWQVAAVMHAIEQDTGNFPMVEVVGALWGIRDGEPDDTPPHVVEVAAHHLDMPPLPLRAIRQKINRIEGLISDGFDPTDAQVECKEDQYPCPYWYLHPTELAGGKKASKPAVKKFTVDPDDQMARDLITLRGYAARLGTLESDRRKITQARDEVRARVAAWLDERGVDVHGGSADVNGTVVERVWQERAGYTVQPSTTSYVKVLDETVSGDGEKKVRKPRKSKGDTQ